MKPIGVQLYSLREKAAKDFPAVIKEVADVGYSGVEPAGLFGFDPKDVKKMVEDLGMVVSSNHQPWPNLDNLEEVIDVASGLGTDTVICGWGSDFFTSVDQIKKTADTANGIVERLSKSGLKVAVHNHYWEFEKIDGRLAYDIFIEQCPNLLCELDTYWAANFGANDPTELVKKYRDRTPLLHIKDGPLKKEELQSPAGAGKMDIPSIIGAANDQVLQWIVVELDNCSVDLSEAVKQSYQYLTSKGLASGRK